MPTFRRVVLSLIALILPFLAFTLFNASGIRLEATTASAQSASKLKEQEDDVRKSMVIMSRQLGVTCTSCHNTQNFKSAEKMEFKVALEHIKLTQVLIDHGMDGTKGQPKADCYMCHRGVLKPDYKEKIDPLQK